MKQAKTFSPRFSRRTGCAFLPPSPSLLSNRPLSPGCGWWRREEGRERKMHVGRGSRRERYERERGGLGALVVYDGMKNLSESCVRWWEVYVGRQGGRLNCCMEEGMVRQRWWVGWGCRAASVVMRGITVWWWGIRERLLLVCGDCGGGECERECKGRRGKIVEKKGEKVCQSEVL